MRNRNFFAFNKKVFPVCSPRHLFVRVQDSNETFATTEGCISFVTEHGFFAALGHNEASNDVSYDDAEVYALREGGDALTQAGRVLCSTSSGIFCALYDDYTPFLRPPLNIASLQHLRVNATAELWMPTERDGLCVFKGKIVALFPGKPHPILFLVENEKFQGAMFGCSGSIIIQDGKLAAIVAGANDNPATLLYCTSAEQMIDDLEQMLLRIAE